MSRPLPPRHDAGDTRAREPAGNVLRSPAGASGDLAPALGATLQIVTQRYNAAGAPTPSGGAQVPAGGAVGVAPGDVMHRLTVQQVRAVELLIVGSTDAAVARVVNVHRVTITRWRLYNLHFQAELNRRRQEVWGATADGVRGMLGKAVEVVGRQLGSDDLAVSFRAARTLLQLAGGGRFAPSDEPADPMGLLDAAARAKHVERRAGQRGDDPEHEPVEEADRLAALDDLNRRRRALGEGEGEADA